MSKKLIFGSVIVVAVLVGVSLTSVVGYQSVKSDVKASPLFNIRTSRAIDEESKDFTCDYVGKGEVSILSIPTRKYSIQMVEKFIESISKMDDVTFNRFKNSIINYLRNEYNNDDETISESVTLLNQLRNEPMKLSELNGENKFHSEASCGFHISYFYICYIIEFLIFWPIYLALFIYDWIRAFWLTGGVEYWCTFAVICTWWITATVGACFTCPTYNPNCSDK